MQLILFFLQCNFAICPADLNNIFTAHEGLPIAIKVSFSTEGRRGDHSASQQGRRLVSPLHARWKFGHRDIQRRDARIGEQARLEASSRRTGSEGRASRSLIEVSVSPCSRSRSRRCPLNNLLFMTLAFRNILNSWEIVGVHLPIAYVPASARIVPC